MKFSYTLPTLCLLAATTASPHLQACPLLGQQYPSPTGLANQPAFQAVAKALDSTLNQTTQKNPYNETTFSIGMFNLADEGLVYQYHYTDSVVSNSSLGARSVNADSVYRIGSVSKLLTMYLFLIREGDKRFNDPISDYIPEFAGKSDLHTLVTPDWNDITIGDLAGQMGGIARDYALDDLASPSNGFLPIPQALRKSLPKLQRESIPTCGYATTNYSIIECSPHEYLEGVASESPLFPTAYTPVYSNEGFATIGLALENIAGRSFEAMFNESLVKPLGLYGTYYTVPSTVTSRDVIPGNPSIAGWSNDLGVATPAGGFFSSVNDMATIGKAILNATLLPKSTTRRWMKPTSFVEDFAQGVGRPWEIFRVKVNGQTIDLYSKSGNWNAYNAFYVLIPTYDFGIVLLTAGNIDVSSELPNLLVDLVLPALDQVARDQAAAKFTGHYISKANDSSLTISANNQSGLTVTEWNLNGSSLLEFLASVTPNLVYRILPNQLFQGNKVGFTSFYESATPPSKSGNFFEQCFGWVDVDETTYGNIPLGQMVFEIGEDGKASSVDLKGVRMTLKRQTS